jgi:serine O-acetyltransferase
MISVPVNSLRQTAEALCHSYEDGLAISYYRDRDLPQRDQVLGILDEMLEVLFPGYTGRYRIDRRTLDTYASERLEHLHTALTEQLAPALCYRRHLDELETAASESLPPSHRRKGSSQPCECASNHDQLHQEASEVASELLGTLPAIREMLKLDCQAALDGDPATRSLDEIILAYPGFKAVTIYRLAHELYIRRIPLVPRIMTEYAHTVTGIDINPGATIGKSFFIDHGTGVVIGETAILGDNVKLYQGVTLGALSFPKDGCGHLIKGAKRHPNLEDNVTVYAGATILGDVTIAHHSTIGGNVWLTTSITEPYSRVLFTPADLSITISKHPVAGADGIRK